MKFNFSFLRNNFRFLLMMNLNFFSFENLFKKMILKVIVFFLKKLSSMKEFFMTLVMILLQNFDSRQSDAWLRHVKK